MTKAQERMYNNYKNATATTLRDVYGRYSRAKEEAMEYCRKRQYELGGWDGKIVSASTFQFAYSFQFKDADGDVALCYITKAQEKCFPII